MSKELEKNLSNALKTISKSKPFKIISSSLYNESNGIFTFCTFAVAEHDKIVYRINVKKMFYDDLFWQIMHIEEKLTPKIRTEGAFAAPSVKVSDASFVSCGDTLVDSEKIVNAFEMAISCFSNSEYIEKKVWGQDDFLDQDIIRCLECFNSGDLDQTREIAVKNITENYRGRFIIGGKGFFEWVLDSVSDSNERIAPGENVLNIERTATIDGIGYDKTTSTLVLLLADGMDWSNERKHLKLLKEKLRSYFTYIETKQYMPKYSNVEKTEIQIKFLYNEPTKCFALLRKFDSLASRKKESIAINVEHGCEE